MHSNTKLNSAILLFIALCASTIHSYAQCFQNMDSHEWQHYQEHLKSINSLKTANTEALMYVPLSIFVINKNDGSGGMDHKRIMDDIELLNKSFVDSKLKFYVCGSITSINSTPNYEFTDTVASTSLPQSYNVANTVNIIYHRSLHLKNFGYAGGFASYPGGSMRIHMSQSSGSYTLAHEMGHFWGLPHTFQNSESTDLRYKELVTRGANANCSTAGDAICDTPADPYVYGEVSIKYENCTYKDTLRDSNGDLYNPMIDNIMSYYFGCNTEIFTPGQHAVMKSYKTSIYRSNWSSSCPQVNAPTNLTATLDPKYGIKLNWTDNSNNELGFDIEVSVGNDQSFVAAKVVAANTTQYFFGNLSSNTSFYFRVKPINSASNFSNVAMISTQKAYCIPMNSSNCKSESIIMPDGQFAPTGIGKVSLDAETKLSQISLCGVNGYDYFSTPTKVYKGVPYNLIIDNLKENGYGEYVGYNAWIDLNDDGVFSDVNERIDITLNTNSASYNFQGTINIDPSVSNGHKRLRIRTSPDRTNLSACESVRLGETEDYVLDVMTLPTSFPVQLSALYQTKYFAQVSWTNTTLPASTKCLLYSKYNTEGYKFVDTVLLSQSSYTSLLNKSGTYTYLLRKASDNSLISNMSAITANDIVYCIPTYEYPCTLPSDRTIERVRLFGETTLDNSSGCAAKWFTNFTNTPTKLYTGMTYKISVTQSKNNGGWSRRAVLAWIDFNNNGSFEDAGEKFTLEQEVYTSVYSGGITVPANTTLGAKTMRVRMGYGNSMTSCSFEYYGETEDYQILVEQIPSTFPVSLNTNQSSPYTAHLNWTYTGISQGTKIYVYKSFNGSSYELADSTVIENLNLENMIAGNGNYKFLIRKASDGLLLSNESSLTISNYQFPIQLKASVINNIVRLSWNNVSIIDKGLISRSYGNSTYFGNLDTVKISNLQYDDIKFLSTDSSFSYRILNLKGEIISNEVKINTVPKHCIPNFSNTACLNGFSSYIFEKVNQGSSRYLLSNPYCSPDGNTFVEQRSHLKIDTLHPNYSYSFVIYTESSCPSNVAVNNFRNIKVWLDSNEDMIFQANEVLYASPSSSYLCFHNFEYKLPEDIDGGLKRMRFIITDKNEAIEDACGNYTLGTGYDLFFYIKKTDMTVVGLDDSEAMDIEQVFLFPNPSENGKFSIESKSEITNMKVMNELGMLIYDGNPTKCGTLAPGLYIVDLYTHGSSYGKKLKFISK